MDAFFAAVEQRDHPELQNRPIVVSGRSQRSVVSTASYEARKFGIHSAMPVFKALQLCPELIIVPGDKKKYAAESKAIMDILSAFSPLVEPVSIDEAYVDVKGCVKLFGSPRTIAETIKSQIKERRNLTCSIGIAPLKFLAKIASDMNKPAGLTLISPDKAHEFIRHLPIEKVPGVGKQAMNRMRQLNINTLGDVYRFDEALLKNHFGIFGSRLFSLSRGIDDNPVTAGHERKSISSETTLSQDIHDFKDARNILLSHSQRVGMDLRQKNMVCHAVSIKVKFSDFTQITRSQKTPSPICSSKAIFDHALALYSKVKPAKKIRLLGVGVSHLRDKGLPVQMDLFNPPGQVSGRQWEKVDSAADAVAKKFGADLIKKASLTPGHSKKETG